MQALAAIPETHPASAPGREAIEGLQLRKVKALLEAIIPANPFYTRKLAQVGAIDLEYPSLERFSATVPFTTKHEIVRDRLETPPYGTNLTFPLENYVRCHQTSGTTTVPMRWLDTRESWDHLVRNWEQILDAAGVQNRDRFFFAFSFGPFLGFWSAVEAVNRRGHFSFPGGGMTSLARVQAILDNAITVLCCTPTYALHLGELAREKGLDLGRSKVRLIVVAGEAGGSIPAVRSRIETLWPGATVFDHHGMTEVGPVTYQCPAGPGLLHVLDAAYIAEVIDPHTGSALPPGKTGELVLTTLDRIGSPLLRYRTGDLVKIRKPGVCACGRVETAFEGGILGRSDDMVVVRGVNVFPGAIDELVRSHGDISEYRVEVDCQAAMTELVLEIEPLPGCSDPGELGRRVEQSIHAALNLRVPVRPVPAGTLPRFEMKARRWVKKAGLHPG